VAGPGGAEAADAVAGHCQDKGGASGRKRMCAPGRDDIGPGGCRAVCAAKGGSDVGIVLRADGIGHPMERCWMRGAEREEIDDHHAAIAQWCENAMQRRMVGSSVPASARDGFSMIQTTSPPSGDQRRPSR
jgi:hypothetical protein